MPGTEMDTGTTADTAIGRDMRVRLLGGFAVLVDGRVVPESAWRLRRAKDIVKLLALAPDHRLHREQVMEALWPDRTPDAAANNLHQALHVARRALGAAGGGTDLLRLRDGLLHLCPEGELRIDADAYADAARAARTTRAVADYLDARALYRGALLPDDRYEDWCTAERDALEQDHVSLLWELAARQSEEADLAGAVETLRALVAMDPAHEAGHRELMRAYALDGRRRLALRQFQVLRTTLRRELDVDPSDETETVYEDILQGRLGFAEPTSFDASAAAPIAVSASRSSPAHNLPVSLSSFVGRERETGDIGRLLVGARLLTLTGPGGCGKTRLAIEAAWGARGEFADGVWLVQLAPLGHESLVVQAVAEVFEVREQAGTRLLDSVIAHLAEREALVVLDNCEHLVDACAQLAQALLSSCAQLRVMTTSREPLRIAGEVVFRVPSLALPDPGGGSSPDVLATVSSVQLFVERAQAAAPGFELTADNAADVAGLCYHLDGLPLAIELAASRVVSLQPSAIAERLSDRFRLLVGGDRTAIGRQQTLKATLDWSYRLLTDTEQAVLRRLAVFVGGVPLDAAEDVCAGGVVEPGEVLPVIGALVDKSLTVPLAQGTEPRFRLLETVREYGLEQLGAAGERAAVEARHAAWFLDLAKLVRDALPLPQRGALLDRLELEHDNVRAAFDRSVGPDPALALRLAANLWHFWLWRAYLAEGRRRIDLATSREPDRSSDRAEALLGAAALAIRSGDVDVGPGFARASVDLAEQIGDHRLACRALQVMGVAEWSKDELIDAEAIYAESLAIATRSGFEPGRAAAMQGLGIVAWYAGDQERSEGLLGDSLTAFRSLEDHADLAPPMLDVGEFLVPHTATGGLRIAFQETFGTFIDVPCRTAVGYVLANEGMLAGLDGDLRRARVRTEESLELFEELGDDRAIGQSLARLGNLAAAEGAFARARELLEQASEVRTRIGDWRGVMMTQLGLGNIAVEEGALEEADRLLREVTSTFRHRGDKWGYVGALSDLANLALAEGNATEAKACLEESIELAEITRRPRWVAWAWVQLGEIARIEGDDAGARASVTRALEMFQRVGDERGARHCRALLEQHPAGRPSAS